MAIDETTSSTTEKSGSSAIENEFPTYRAISALAVWSLIFGAGSILSFASPWFLILTVISVTFGVMSLRKIKRLPDVLTGAKIANAGIGVGLLFGLSAVTHTVVETISTTNEASNFAKYYVEVIKEKPVNYALWYQQSIEYRKTKSPDEAAEEMKIAKNPTSPDPYGSKTAPFTLIKERLKTSGQKLSFVQLEGKAIDGLTLYANALLEIDGPTSEKFPKKEYALIQMVKPNGGGPRDWVVREFTFPYTPATAKVEVEHKVDDGHGH